MADQDYYNLLGVPKTATSEEIKRAYRRLALEWHPDRHAGDKKQEAEKKFKEINEAYQVLSDTKKRQAYDQFGHAAFRGGGFGGASGGNQYGSPFGGGFRQGPFTYTYTTGGNPYEGFDFSDPFEIFEQFFGGGGFGGARNRRRPRYKLSIDFLEAVRGTTKEVHVPKGEAGAGSEAKTIRIPAGVDTGSRIQFDAFEILIEVRADKVFHREGDDLIIDAEVSIPTAVLGGTITVPTIDGNVSIKVKPATKSGSLIRLREKGVPHVRGGGKGDQYVRIQYKMPAHITRRAKELFLELEEELE